jgi:hypothetical protein
MVGPAIELRRLHSRQVGWLRGFVSVSDCRRRELSPASPGKESSLVAPNSDKLFPSAPNPIRSMLATLKEEYSCIHSCLLRSAAR